MTSTENSPDAKFIANHQLISQGSYSPCSNQKAVGQHLIQQYQNQSLKKVTRAFGEELSQNCEQFGGEMSPNKSPIKQQFFDYSASSPDKFSLQLMKRSHGQANGQFVGSSKNRRERPSSKFSLKIPASPVKKSTNIENAGQAATGDLSSRKGMEYKTPLRSVVENINHGTADAQFLPQDYFSTVNNENKQNTQKRPPVPSLNLQSTAITPSMSPSKQNAKAQPQPRPQSQVQQYGSPLRKQVSKESPFKKRKQPTPLDHSQIAQRIAKNTSTISGMVLPEKLSPPKEFTAGSVQLQLQIQDVEDDSQSDFEEEVSLPVYMPSNSKKLSMTIKVEDTVMVPETDSYTAFTAAPLSKAFGKPKNARINAISPKKASPLKASPQKASPQKASPQKASPMKNQLQNESPEKENSPSPPKQSTRTFMSSAFDEEGDEQVANAMYENLMALKRQQLSQFAVISSPGSSCKKAYPNNYDLVDSANTYGLQNGLQKQNLPEECIPMGSYRAKDADQSNSMINTYIQYHDDSVSQLCMGNQSTSVILPQQTHSSLSTRSNKEKNPENSNRRKRSQRLSSSKRSNCKKSASVLQKTDLKEVTFKLTGENSPTRNIQKQPSQFEQQNLCLNKVRNQSSLKKSSARYTDQKRRENSFDERSSQNSPLKPRFGTINTTSLSPSKSPLKPRFSTYNLQSQSPQKSPAKSPIKQTQIHLSMVESIENSQMLETLQQSPMTNKETLQVQNQRMTTPVSCHNDSVYDRLYNSHTPVSQFHKSCCSKHGSAQPATPQQNQRESSPSKSPQKMLSTFKSQTQLKQSTEAQEIEHQKALMEAQEIEQQKALMEAQEIEHQNALIEAQEIEKTKTLIEAQRQNAALSIQSAYKCSKFRQSVSKGLVWRHRVKTCLNAVIEAWRTRRSLNCLGEEVQEYVNCERRKRRQIMKAQFLKVFELVVTRKLYLESRQTALNDMLKQYKQDLNDLIQAAAAAKRHSASVKENKKQQKAPQPLPSPSKSLHPNQQVLILDDNSQSMSFLNETSTPMHHQTSIVSNGIVNLSLPIGNLLQRSPSKSPSKSILRSPSKSPVKNSIVNLSLPVGNLLERSPSKSPQKSPSKSPVKISPMKQSPMRKPLMRQSPMKVQSPMKSPTKQSVLESPVKLQNKSSSFFQQASPSPSPKKKTPTYSKSPSKELESIQESLPKENKSVQQQPSSPKKHRQSRRTIDYSQNSLTMTQSAQVLVTSSNNLSTLTATAQIKPLLHENSSACSILSESLKPRESKHISKKEQKPARPEQFGGNGNNSSVLLLNEQSSASILLVSPRLQQSKNRALSNIAGKYQHHHQRDQRETEKGSPQKQSPQKKAEHKSLIKGNSFERITPQQVVDRQNATQQIDVKTLIPGTGCLKNQNQPQNQTLQPNSSRQHYKPEPTACSNKKGANTTFKDESRHNSIPQQQLNQLVNVEEQSAHSPVKVTIMDENYNGTDNRSSALRNSIANHGSAYKQKLQQVRSRIDCWNSTTNKSQERKPDTAVSCSAGSANVVAAAIAVQNINDLIPTTTSFTEQVQVQRASSSGALSSLNSTASRIRMPAATLTSSAGKNSNFNAQSSVNKPSIMQSANSYAQQAQQKLQAQKQARAEAMGTVGRLSREARCKSTEQVGQVTGLAGANRTLDPYASMKPSFSNLHQTQTLQNSPTRYNPLNQKVQRYSFILEELFKTLDTLTTEESSTTMSVQNVATQNKGDMKRKRIQVAGQADKKFRKLVRDLGEQFNHVKSHYQNQGPNE